MPDTIHQYSTVALVTIAIFAILFIVPMFYLFTALFFSSCIFVTFKYFNKFGISILPAITMSYLMAAAFGYASRWQTTSLPALTQQSWFFMAIVTGISFILTFFVYAVSTQKVGVAMTVVSSKMSVVISVAIGFLFLSEPLSTIQIAGIGAAMAAFYLTNRVSGKVKVEKKFLILPAIIFFGTGVNDSLMKVSGVLYADRDPIQFLTVTFLTAFIIGFAITMFQVCRKTQNIKWKDIVAGVLLSVFNWYSTYFFIKGLYVLPISIFIPVFNAAIVVIAAVSGYFFFDEKLSIVNRVGIALAVLSIAAIALS